MKKSLIALAALAAVSAASAQSNVTLSGLLVITAGNVAYNGAPTRFDIGRSTGSVTMDGTEDLGGGLKANFRIQQGVYGFPTNGLAANTGLSGNTVGNFGDRQAFLQLMGGFGTVKIGRDLTGLSTAVFGSAQVSNVQAISGIDDNGNDAAFFANLRTTSISYATPNISGFTAYVGMTPQNYSGMVLGSPSSTVGTGSANDASVTAGIAGDNRPTTASLKQDTPVAYGVVYSNGPLTAAFDHTDFQEAAGGTNLKTNSFGANYDFGIAKVGVGYQAISADGKADTKSTLFSATVPLSAQLSLGAAYGKRNAVANGAWSSAGTKHTLVGANYTLSKRTMLYAAYSKKDVGGAAVSLLDIKETGVGIRHAF